MRFVVDPVLAASHSLIAALLSTDAHGLVDGEHENLTIADLARLGRLQNRIGRGLHGAVGQDDLQFQLGQKIHCVLAPAVDFGVTLLAPETLDLGDRHAFDAHACKRFLDVFELKRLDYGLNFFHQFPPLVRVRILENRLGPVNRKSTLTTSRHRRSGSQHTVYMRRNSSRYATAALATRNLMHNDLWGNRLDMMRLNLRWQKTGPHHAVICSDW